MLALCCGIDDNTYFLFLLAAVRGSIKIGGALGCPLGHFVLVLQRWAEYIRGNDIFHIMHHQHNIAFPQAFRKHGRFFIHALLGAQQ